MGLGTYSLQIRRRGCCPEHAPAANEMSDIEQNMVSLKAVLLPLELVWLVHMCHKDYKWAALVTDTSLKHWMDWVFPPDSDTSQKDLSGRWCFLSCRQSWWAGGQPFVRLQGLRSFGSY